MGEKNDPINSIDSLFEDNSYNFELSKILFFGTKDCLDEFNSKIDPKDLGFSLDFVQTMDEAIPLLLQKNYTIILLDCSLQNVEISSILKNLRKNQHLTRIILIIKDYNVSKLGKIINNNPVDGFIQRPFDNSKLMKIIMEQDAKYSIEKEVTAFVSKPPKLSKASFLLLDPTLTFGDENQPLNFVGVMIVVNTVPKYTKFFEDTLSNDEFLFAGYLSSITSLGDNLFNNSETFKEINFGGISVIFRFHEKIQISFFVRNLTSYNYEKAEERIDKIVNLIIEKYEDDLSKRFLTHEKEAELNKLFVEFDRQDLIEEKKFEEIQKKLAKREFGEQFVLIFSLDNPLLQIIGDTLRFENDKHENTNYYVKDVSDENEITELMKVENIGVIILDGESLKNKSVIFIGESIKELDPSVQIIYLNEDELITDELSEIFNSGYFGYLFKKHGDLLELTDITLKALERSFDIKKQTATGIGRTTSRDSLSIAKKIMKEDLESFDSAILPILQGIVIALSLEPVFDKFWEVDGELIEFDVGMMTGLITSLKQISGEMFNQTDNVDNLELGGSHVFVRNNSDYSFIYFVKNVSPNTSVIIAKEIDAISTVFIDILIEAAGLLTFDQLEPLFLRVAEKAHSKFTELLAEKSE